MSPSLIIIAELLLLCRPATSATVMCVYHHTHTLCQYNCSLRHARTHATLVPIPGLVGDAGKPPHDMSAGINTWSRPLVMQP